MIPADAVIDAAYLTHQRAWSTNTFGPGPRTTGITAHIAKELDEVRAQPGDITEWADIVILAFDGALAEGHDPQSIIDAIHTKQATNEARTWPNWQHITPGTPIEHNRDQEIHMNAELNVPPDSARDVAGEQDTTDPSTDEVRDIWVDWHLNPLPRDEGVALVPTYQEAFDRWLAAVVRASGTTSEADRLREGLVRLLDKDERNDLSGSPHAEGWGQAIREVKHFIRCLLDPDTEERAEWPHLADSGDTKTPGGDATRGAVEVLPTERASSYLAVSGVTPGNPTREQIVRALIGAGIDSEDFNGRYAGEIADVVLALFPSPAPGDQQAEIERLRAKVERVRSDFRDKADEARTYYDAARDLRDALSQTEDDLRAARADLTALRDRVKALAAAGDRMHRTVSTDRLRALLDGHPAPNTQDDQS